MDDAKQTDAKQTYDRVSELAIELGDEILRRASSSEVAFRLIRTAAITMQVRVGLGIKAPKFRERIVDEQNERLGKLGIDPLPVFADRAPGGG